MGSGSWELWVIFVLSITSHHQSHRTQANYFPSCKRRVRPLQGIQKRLVLCNFAASIQEKVFRFVSFHHTKPL